jgi:hypothetical protein
VPTPLKRLEALVHFPASTVDENQSQPSLQVEALLTVSGMLFVIEKLCQENFENILHLFKNFFIAIPNRFGSRTD